MDLDTSIYLRAIEATYLLIFSHTQSFPLHRYVCLVLTSLPIWEVAPGLGKLGRVSCWCYVSCLQSPVLRVADQDCYVFPSIGPCGSSPTSRIFPSAKIFTLFLLDTPSHRFCPSN